MLDVNLGDTRSYPIADLLFENGTPFLFATGYGHQGLEAAYQTEPVIQKPYLEAQMAHLLTRLLTEYPPGRRQAGSSHKLGVPAAPCG